MRQLYIIMGPAGCGKSSITEALSEATGWPMIEADDHHSDANVAKQAAGHPLTDEDRAAWIDSIVNAVNGGTETNTLLACSALTPYVQERLSGELEPECHWFLLEVSEAELARRLSSRKDHFMPASLLQDQLEALSAPNEAHRINGEQSIERICADILGLFNS
ncbi:MAG: gluconokinase [Henriciella sp.]